MRNQSAITALAERSSQCNGPLPEPRSTAAQLGPLPNIAVFMALLKPLALVWGNKENCGLMGFGDSDLDLLGVGHWLSIRLKHCEAVICRFMHLLIERLSGEGGSRNVPHYAGGFQRVSYYRAVTERSAGVTFLLWRCFDCLEASSIRVV